MILNPYLIFNGNCEEAMNFYREALGGEITGISRYEGSPMATEPDDASKILHGEMTVGESKMMFCDGLGDHASVMGNNIQLSLNFSEVNVLHNRFQKLSEGGTVVFEPQDTFWGARFGMLKDKFGIHWMLNCQLTPPEHHGEGMSNIETVIK